MNAEDAKKFVEDCFREAMSHHIGGIPSRAAVEKSLSDASGFPCRLPDYDEKTGVATIIEICLPVPINYRKIDIVLEAPKLEWVQENLCTWHYGESDYFVGSVHPTDPAGWSVYCNDKRLTKTMTLEEAKAWVEDFYASPLDRQMYNAARCEDYRSGAYWGRQGPLPPKEK